MKSDSIANLAVALIKAQSAFPVIEKTKTAEITMKSGGKYKYTYADLGDVKEKTQPILTANRLAVCQFPAVLDGHQVLITYLLHESGEFLAEPMWLHSAADPQGQGSSITYARRYAWCAVLGIVAEDDDDARSAQPPPQQQRSRPKAQSAPKDDAPKHPLEEKFQSQNKVILAARAKASEMGIEAPRTFAQVIGNEALVATLMEE